jgi:putative transposase
VKATLAGVSERRLCRVLAIARTWARRGSGSRSRRPVVNEVLAARVAELIQAYPIFGYRRLWALLRFRDGQRLTPKAVYRLCAL